METSKVMPEQAQTPEILDNILSNVGGLLNSFHLSSEGVASNKEVQNLWKELPKELDSIPEEYRNEFITKMCIAASAGLFDSALNYIWNPVIVNLRSQISNFGLENIKKILGGKYTGKKIEDLTDANIIDLCHKLELLSEGEYVCFNQCRELRNKFSTAHPSIGRLDDRELLNFISRARKYGFSADCSLQGIDVEEFVEAINKSPFTQNTINAWQFKLENTFPIIRRHLIAKMHGIYCCAHAQEHAQNNVLSICQAIKPLFDDEIKAILLGKHEAYLTKNEEQKANTSRLFFQKMELLNWLHDMDREAVIQNACETLWQVHKGKDNFYKEPDPAKALWEIISKTKIPDKARYKFVEVVATCCTGNEHGASNDAVPYYEKMIAGFGPKEIEILLGLPDSTLDIAKRIKYSSECKERFVKSLDLLNQDGLSEEQKDRLEKLKKL